MARALDDRVPGVAARRVLRGGGANRGWALALVACLKTIENASRYATMLWRTPPLFNRFDDDDFKAAVRLSPLYSR